MDTKLQDALKKAKIEVETVGISDLELKKIAFSKAVDFYLREEVNHPRENRGEKKANSSKLSDFWVSLAAATGIDQSKLKDTYSAKEEQILLVISSVPGESKADKRRNLAALILLAYHEGLQYEWISSSLLAEAAAHSGLYNTSKFAKNLKSNQSNWFRSEGVKKGSKYKLSGPGLKQAKDLLVNITKQ